jgi:hypothetical protein
MLTSIVVDYTPQSRRTTSSPKQRISTVPSCVVENYKRKLKTKTDRRVTKRLTDRERSRFTDMKYSSRDAFQDFEENDSDNHSPVHYEYPYEDELPRNPQPIVLVEYARNTVLAPDDSTLEYIAKTAHTSYFAYFTKPKHQRYSKHVVCIDDLHTWIYGAENITRFMTGHTGYGHGQLYAVAKVAYNGTFVFILWQYKSGSCSYCDADKALEDTDDVVQFAADVYDKIKSGRIFATLIDLAESLRNGTSYDRIELFNSLIKTMPPEFSEEDRTDFEHVANMPLLGNEPIDDDAIPDDACQLANGYPEPSFGVMTLINSGKSASLRDLLGFIGRDDISTDASKLLGRHLIQHLGYVKRDKESVMREGKKIYVTMYKSGELGKAEHYIRGWLTNRIL